MHNGNLLLPTPVLATQREPLPVPPRGAHNRVAGWFHLHFGVSPEAPRGVVLPSGSVFRLQRRFLS